MGYSPWGHRELDTTEANEHKQYMCTYNSMNFSGKETDSCFNQHTLYVEYACNSGEPGSIPGSGRSPGEGNGNPLQYFFLGNPVARGAWWGYSPQGCKELDTTE